MKRIANDIPPNATGLHVFAIKETVDGVYAFIGWYLPNGNFNYSQIPYMPKNTIRQNGHIPKYVAQHGICKKCTEELNMYGGCRCNGYTSYFNNSIFNNY